MRTSSFSSRPIDTAPDSGSGCIENMFAPMTMRWRTPSSMGTFVHLAHGRRAGRGRVR
jgi:hypothetical protein